uniref:Uncharacterized protein n=1 Tax=Aquila chrysaetos chrysaetos TaxID=223781 RepID=A0A663FFV6_AQUCH
MRWFFSLGLHAVLSLGYSRGRETFRSVRWLHQALQLQGLIQLTQCLPPAQRLQLFPLNLSFQSTVVHTPPGESLAPLISRATMSREPCGLPSFRLICGLKTDLSMWLKAWREHLHPQSLLLSTWVWGSPTAGSQGRQGDAPPHRSTPCSPLNDQQKPFNSPPADTTASWITSG